MGNLGGGEILVILLAALLFLGPQKLPDAARQIGKAMAEFRKLTSGFQRELNEALNTDSKTEAEARAAGDALVASERAQASLPTDPPVIEPPPAIQPAPLTEPAPVIEHVPAVEPPAISANDMPASGDR